MIFTLILSVTTVSADECTQKREYFEQVEQAYDVVRRVDVAGNSAYEIVSKFVEEGEALLKYCPKVYSLDRHYTLRRKLKKARWASRRFMVLTQKQLEEYAISHPEQQVIYKWGTVRISP